MKAKDVSTTTISSPGPLLSDDDDDDDDDGAGKCTRSSVDGFKRDGFL